MRAFLRDHLTWTPERGTLSAEDGLANLSRFSRSCAAVLEDIRHPDQTAPVVVGTATGAAESPATIASELAGRWPNTDVHLVSAGVETVPASLLEAIALLRRYEVLSWVVVDLHPGAELVGAFTLANETPGRRLSLSRLAEPAQPPARHLNPCAAVSSLGATRRDESVSIKVGRWSVALATTN